MDLVEQAGTAPASGSLSAQAAVAVAPARELPSLRSGWGLTQTIVIVGLVGFLYYGILSALGQQWWNDPDFSHGFFVPLFSGYLIWSRRDELSKIQIKPSWWGVPLIMFAAAVLIVGTMGAELFLSRTSFIFLLAGLVLLFTGWKMFKALLFPLLFLFLMVPIPAIIFNLITFPLQLLASEMAANILPFFGVPVLREGNVINLPAMPLEVAEACSGIRSLLSLETLALIYGYLMEKSIPRRIVLALAALPIAVFANAMRIVGTGLAVQYWNPDRALGFFHEFSGWVIFVVSLITLFCFHALMNRFGRKPKAAVEAA